MTRAINEAIYTVRRLTVPVPGVRGFQEVYEELVPELPHEEVEALIRRQAPWSEMLELIDASAPNGFLIYFRNDARPVMQAAGDQADCISYLMGNHTIAERMFRHSALAMLYAPLRTIIWEDPDGDAWFSVDQPSTLFSSLGIPDVTEVGHDLDRTLASHLATLCVDVPVVLLGH